MSRYLNYKREIPFKIILNICKLFELTIEEFGYFYEDYFDISNLERYKSNKYYLEKIRLYLNFLLDITITEEDRYEIEEQMKLKLL